VGELLVRGPNVTEGYWQNPDATEDSFDGEWFRTGDVVEQRPDGYLAFRERTKQLLVLSTGKNVAPRPIEDSFASNPLIEQCMVLGDGEKFVAAILVPNISKIREWADGEGFDLPDETGTLLHDERVQDRMKREVVAVNEDFEDYERIKRFALVPDEFTEENDLVTPTMKKKRRNIIDRYDDEIETIYDR